MAVSVINTVDAFGVQIKDMLKEKQAKVYSLEAMRWNFNTFGDIKRI